jgi:hypothetical protein
MDHFAGLDVSADEAIDILPGSILCPQNAYFCDVRHSETGRLRLIL